LGLGLGDRDPPEVIRESGMGDGEHGERERESEDWLR
jgi:hypothetical protein